MLRIRFIFWTLALLLSASVVSSAQDTTTIYFDEDWNEVSQADAFYLRKSFKKDKKQWGVIDYFNSGGLQMTGTFADKKLRQRKGLFTWYYENGQKRSEGEYENNERQGEWLWYHDNGQLSSKELFKQGEVEDYTFWNRDGSELHGDYEYRTEAEFPGGKEAMTEYLATNMEYPEVENQLKTPGKIYVQFDVDENGEVRNPRIVRSQAKVLNEACLKLVREMPNWTPCVQHNLKSRCSYTLPINIQFPKE